MFHVYVLKSSEGLTYSGSTNDLFRRLVEHNTGLCKTTRAGTRWRLVYCEPYPNRGEAMKREKWMKTGAGRDYVRDRIIGVESAAAE